jgi:hypothetical protein
MRLLGIPNQWIVTLNDGSQVEIWAGSLTGSSEPGDDRDYTFSVVVDDVEPEAQADFEVTARTPNDPRRVVVAVARFPRNSVQDIWSA